MKPGSVFPPPDDEAPDALLVALRQRLGAYGQAPPPAAWAAIRQRVAPPLPPWWRRPQRLLLLALVAGLLLVSTRAGQYSRQLATNQLLTKPTAPTGQEARATKQPRQLARATTAASRSAAGRLPQPATAAKTTSAASSFTSTSPSKATVAASASPSANKANWLTAPSPTGPVVRHNYPSSTSRRPARLATATPTASRTKKKVFKNSIIQSKIVELAAQPAASPAIGTKSTAGHRARGGRRAAQLALGGSTPPTQSTFASPVHRASDLAGRRANRAVHQPTLLRAPRGLAGSRKPDNAQQTALSDLLPAAEQGASLSLLAPRQPSLLLPAWALLPALAARPDSTPPPPLVRRWSVLVLAGPTLSYRTLGPAPTLATGHPDFARLERPALGLGAQVQMRRVLSGRWALAGGLGYHEYATQLALAVQDTPTYKSVRQRDTYRILTVPIQLTYALGVPRGRLATGLLLGAEAGWYLGGRSTEGSGCGCEQQAYAAAAASPYRSLSVAFSLGLDLRYRLGGAASRWQWLVQPTGRYVVTPFVRSDAVGFTRRQPFSLGLLTGFSWDVR